MLGTLDMLPHALQKQSVWLLQLHDQPYYAILSMLAVLQWELILEKSLTSLPQNVLQIL